jgi:TRAP transporter TAXI family solute receptor
MKKFTVSIIALGGLTVSGFSTPAFSADQYTIAVGSLGGTFGRLGAGLAEVFNQNSKDQKLSVVPGGAKANPARIGSGGADIGFSFGNLVKNARSGQFPYKKKIDNLRMIAAFYNSCYHIYASKELYDKGIKTFSDFVNSKEPLKSSVGKKGTSTEYVSSVMIKHLGSSYKDLEDRGFKIVYAGVGASARQISSRSIDFYHHNAGVPNAAGLQAHLSRDLVFLTMKDGTKEALKKAGYDPCVIPGGIYKGAKNDTPSMGSSGIVIGTDKTPDKLVTAFLEISWAKKKTLHDIHKIFKKWDLKKAATDLQIPFHPAAVAFYKKHGIMK